MNLFHIILIFLPSITFSRLWEKFYLTYSVENNTEKAKEIEEAIPEWNFTFLELRRVLSNGDIKIYFVDLPYHILGRAYPPPIGVIEIAKTIKHDYLKCVIQHELGHALGLIHNEESYSIMFPYKLPECKIRLIDVQRLNNLYKCQYDSVTLLNGLTYLKFQGKRYERLDIDTNYKTKGRIWHSDIYSIDAMYRNKTYFVISNKTYYEFNNDMKFLRKGEVSDLGLPSEKIFAVLTFNNRIVAFLGNYRMWYNNRIRHVRDKFTVFPHEEIKGAFESRDHFVVLVTEQDLWFYDYDFKFVKRLQVCQTNLNVTHCCD